MNPCEAILERKLNGERLTLEEGVALFSCDLIRLGQTAQAMKNRLCSDSFVTFVVDRNISYTNACTVNCEFCAFSKPKQSTGVYRLTHDEILSRVAELVDLGGTQVLIQGGVDPEIPLDYYLKLVAAIHEKFPQVCIHSFSVAEFDMMSQTFRIPIDQLLKMFKDAGLNSLPGGGAEILSERVRQILSPRKIDSEHWLEIMSAAHAVGLRSTATMVFGHIETLEERVRHLLRLRDLQDRTAGFRAFIPWTMRLPPNNRLGIETNLAGGEDYLRTVAISRLMLDNFEHIQSGWLTEGLKLGQVALHFGCDDMGGTLMEDKVLEPTGIAVRTKRDDLIRLIREAGFIPAQRSTNYEILQTYC